jgi:hypothetical protein
MPTPSNRFSTGTLTVSLIPLTGCATMDPLGPLGAPPPADIAGLLVIFVLIDMGAYWIGGRIRHGSPRLREDSALVLLKERYARGEIDRETFLERVRDLESVGTRGGRAS